MCLAETDSLITSRNTSRSLKSMAHTVSYMASRVRCSLSAGASMMFHRRQAKVILVQDQHRDCHTHHTKDLYSKMLASVLLSGELWVSAACCRLPLWILLLMQAPSPRIHELALLGVHDGVRPSKVRANPSRNAPFRERRLSRSPAYFCLRLSRAKPFDSTFGPLIGRTASIKTGER